MLKVEACIDDISAWMRKNKLKLNDDKTEYMIISSDRLKAKLTIPELIVGAMKVQPNTLVKNLGCMIDDSLKMVSQVDTIVKRAHFHLRNIRTIRKSLTQTATEQLVHAFVTSTLDYCNALLCGLPTVLLTRLQRVQNMAARVVTLKRRNDSITPVLRVLHWLPVKWRIEFKILVLTWRALNGVGPMYIRDMLTYHNPTRLLRSHTISQLNIPRTRLKTYGDRAFSAMAPTLWNKIPFHIRTSTTLSLFKQKLKMHLFQLAYE